MTISSENGSKVVEEVARSDILSAETGAPFALRAPLITGFEDAKGLVASGRLSGATIDALIRIPYGDPTNGEAAVYALGAAKVRRRNARRVVLTLVAILEDSTLKNEVRAQAPEEIGVHVHHQQRALRRLAVNALRRQLRDPSPDVRFWSAFGLALLSEREARHDLRRLQHDQAIVPGWWSLGDEASDALDIIEGRIPP